MMTSHEFLANWQNAPLIWADESFLNEINIADTDKRFLLEVGLPLMAFNQFDFRRLGKTLQRLSDLIEGQHTLSSKYCNYFVIGSVYNSNYVCLSKFKRHIFLFMPYADSQPLMFLNSSVLHLAECLIIYKEFDAALHKEMLIAFDGASSEEEAEQAYEKGNNLMQEAINKITKADPDILRKKGYWIESVERRLG